MCSSIQQDLRLLTKGAGRPDRLADWQLFNMQASCFEGPCRRSDLSQQEAAAATRTQAGRRDGVASSPLDT